MTRDDWREADAAEAWSLARGPAWLDADTLTVRQRLADEVAELQARRDAIASELETLRADAERRGRESGHRAGQSEVADAAGALRRARHLAVEAATTAAMEVARALVESHVAADPSRVLRLVERAMAASASREPVELRVHPDVAAAIAGTTGPPVRGDSGCGPGDVIVVTQGGRFDGRIETWCALLEPDVRTSILSACGVSDGG